MRIVLTLLTFFGGLALAVVSYVLLAAPLGLPRHEGFSNPRLVYAPILFLIGVLMVFLSPVVYELLPERQK